MKTVIVKVSFNNAFSFMLTRRVWCITRFVFNLQRLYGEAAKIEVISAEAD